VGLWTSQRLQLLGWDDEHAAQVARTVAVAALQADPLLLLARELGGIAEGIAAVIVGDAVVELGARPGQAQERADRIRTLGQLLEQGTPVRLTRGLFLGGLLAAATSEHRL
jgi:hypothetical protein